MAGEWTGPPVSHEAVMHSLRTSYGRSESGASRPPEAEKGSSSGSGASRPPSFTSESNRQLEREIVVALDCVRCEMVSDGTSDPAPMSSSSLRVAGPFYRSFAEALTAAREKRARIEVVPELEALERIAEEMGRAAAGFEERLKQLDPYLATCIRECISAGADVAKVRERRIRMG